MAYSDYGALVHCNGQRRTDKEDVGVFDTDEAIVHEIGDYLDFEAIDVSRVRLCCDYCGRFTKDADLSAEYAWPNQYLMCKRCKGDDSPD